MLVATDNVGRGLSVLVTAAVINYDIPMKMVENQYYLDQAVYVQRAGRTGRYGRRGIAVTICESDEDIEKLQAMA